MKYVGFFYKYQGGGAGFWCVFFGLMRMLDGVWEVGLGCGAGGVRDCIALIVGVMQMLDGVWEVGLGCGTGWRSCLAGGWNWLAELPGRRMGLVGGVAFQVRNGRTRSIVSDEQTAE